LGSNWTLEGEQTQGEQHRNDAREVLWLREGLEDASQRIGA
jgi:hypothetical protein